MKSLDVKSSTCIKFNKENNEKDPKLKICEHAIISKYKITFTKGSVPWSEEVLVIKKVIMVKKLLECFTKKKNCKKQIKKS